MYAYVYIHYIKKYTLHMCTSYRRAECRGGGDIVIPCGIVIGPYRVAIGPSRPEDHNEVLLAS